MKRRLLVSIVAITMSVSAFSAGADITIRPRLEGAYNSIFNKEDFGFGMSSLYSFLEGDISDSFSYYASLHFLSADPKSLYNYDYPCINGTWVDMAYLSYNRDFWGIDLGKVMLNFGGMTNELDDVDCYSGLIPFNWFEFNSYQYGLTFRLTPWENHSFEAQFTTAPYMESFKDMQYAYSLAWRGEMGRYSTAWAVNAFRSYAEPEDEDDEDAPLSKTTNINIGLGNRFEFNDKWNMEFDAYLHLFDCKLYDMEYSDFYLRGGYNPSDKVSIQATVGLKSVKASVFGAVVEYFPIESLRLHAALSYCDCSELDYFVRLKDDQPFEASIGVTYTLDFHLGN